MCQMKTSKIWHEDIKIHYMFQYLFIKSKFEIYFQIFEMKHK